MSPRVRARAAFATGDVIDSPRDVNGHTRYDVIAPTHNAANPNVPKPILASIKRKQRIWRTASLHLERNAMRTRIWSIATLRLERNTRTADEDEDLEYSSEGPAFQTLSQNNTDYCRRWYY